MSRRESKDEEALPLSVASPVTASVEESVAAPVTPKVPVTLVLPKVAPPTERVVAKRLVEEATVLKMLVVVALVMVAFPMTVTLPPMVEEADERKPPGIVTRPVELIVRRLVRVVSVSFNVPMEKVP